MSSLREEGSWDPASNKKLAAVGVAAVVGVASTIALTSGSASASPVFGYSGYGIGVEATGGVVNSGPQTVSTISCTTNSSAKMSNDLATANVNNQAIARTVRTDTHAFNNKYGNGVTSNASAVDIKIGNLLHLTGVKTTTTAVYKNGKLSYTGSTTFAGVKIGASRCRRCSSRSGTPRSPFRAWATSC